jgi:hypothetical protein
MRIEEAIRGGRCRGCLTVSNATTCVPIAVEQCLPMPGLGLGQPSTICALPHRPLSHPAADVVAGGWRKDWLLIIAACHTRVFSAGGARWI